MTKSILIPFALALSISAIGSFLQAVPCRADDPAKPLLVGVSPFSPFVIVSEDSRQLSGFSIDLFWKSGSAGSETNHKAPRFNLPMRTEPRRC